MDNNSMTTAEAAEALGIKYDVFRQYRARGVLKIEPVGQFGSSLVWNRGEVEHLARMRRGL